MWSAVEPSFSPGGLRFVFVPGRRCLPTWQVSANILATRQLMNFVVEATSQVPSQSLGQSTVSRVTSLGKHSRADLVSSGLHPGCRFPLLILLYLFSWKKNLSHSTPSSERLCQSHLGRPGSPNTQASLKRSCPWRDLPSLQSQCSLSRIVLNGGTCIRPERLSFKAAPSFMITLRFNVPSSSLGRLWKQHPL